MSEQSLETATASGGRSAHATAVMAVAVAAVMSGFVGIFTRFLEDDQDIPAFDVAAMRIMVVVLVLFVVLLACDRESLRVKAKDLPMFAVFGILMFLADGTLFYAQEEIVLSLATLLQMTAPYYVMLVSLVLFKEKITGQKLIAMMFTLLGCIMVTGILQGKMSASSGGIMSALLSGLFDGMFAVGGRLGYDRGYKPQTILFYIMLFGLVSSLVFACATSDMPHEMSKLADFDTVGALLVLSVVLTLMPLYMMTYGASRISASLVSMIAVLELVSTTLVGFMFFGEKISVINVIGMAVVVASIVAADMKLSRRVRKYCEENGTENPFQLKIDNNKQE